MGLKRGKYVSKQNIRLLTALGATALLFFGFENCSRMNFTSSSSQASSDATQSVPNPPGNTVCDPLGGGVTNNAEKGLVGSLLYVPTAKQVASNLQNFDQVLGLAVDSGATIYMSQVNVPTRSWTDGFVANGKYLSDNDGNELVEYFVLRMQTVLQLPAGASAGYYQIASISDDGLAVYSTGANGAVTYLAGSHGSIHSTRSDCGTVATPMDASTRLPVSVDYYQGPRTQIAAVLMWRKVADPNNMDMTGCNVTDNTTFFTGNPYQTMLAQGWQVIPPESFNLPATASANPCAGQ